MLCHKRFNNVPKAWTTPTIAVFQLTQVVVIHEELKLLASTFVLQWILFDLRTILFYWNYVEDEASKRPILEFIVKKKEPYACTVFPFTLLKWQCDNRWKLTRRKAFFPYVLTMMTNVVYKYNEWRIQRKSRELNSLERGNKNGS